MTEAVKPPIVPTKEPPINEGVQAHLRRLREAIGQFSTELVVLHRVETALIASFDRLERHVSLIGMETQLLDALLKRDGSKPRPAGREVSVVSIVDKVEADLEQILAESRTVKVS